MKIEVLVSTMNQTDLSIANKMNIQSDSIIINQTDHQNYMEENIDEKLMKMYSFNEKGVGLSRNNALMRASGDICLMADDDMVYIDNYEEKVISAFKKNPKADVILFNVPIHKKDGSTLMKVKKNGQVRFFNALKYGTVNFAFRRDIILKKNIWFSLLFGGGTRYSSGEDSIFISDVFKHRLKVYSSTSIIANINEGTSTWFDGYNKKYFYDRGALYRVIGGKMAFLLNLQFLLRHKKLYSQNHTFFEAFMLMMKGSREYYNIGEGK